MSLLNILGSNNYFLYNKIIAKKLSVESAIMLGFFSNQFIYYEKTNQLKNINGELYFYATRDTIFEETGLTESISRKATKLLKDKNILIIEKIGIPAKNYYHINEEELKKYLGIIENISSLKNKEQDIENCNNKSLKNSSQIINKNNNKNNNIINNINIINNENLENSTNIEKNNSNNITNIIKKDIKEKNLIKKQKEAIKRKDMILAYTQDEDIRNALNKYLEFRKTRGLTLEQWKSILDNLRTISDSKKEVALQIIEKAYQSSWNNFYPINNFKGNIKSTYSSKSNFDNTAEHKQIVKRLSDVDYANLSEEEKIKYISKLDYANLTKEQKELFNEKCLAKDENGNLKKY